MGGVSDFGPSHYRLLAILRRYLAEGAATPSHAELAPKVGVTPQRVERLLDGLIARGIVRRYYDGCRRALCVDDIWLPDQITTRPYTIKRRTVPIVALGEYVERDPCPRCGVRGDIGCRHRPASWPVRPLTSQDGRT